MVLQGYATYPAILDSNYEDVMKLNAIIDCQQHYKNEQNVNNESNQATKLEFIKAMKTH